jgi:hypothetical protein
MKVRSCEDRLSGFEEVGMEEDLGPCLGSITEGDVPAVDALLVLAPAL